jgi:hypothetical protein
MEQAMLIDSPVILMVVNNRFFSRNLDAVVK